MSSSPPPLPPPTFPIPSSNLLQTFTSSSSSQTYSLVLSHTSESSTTEVFEHILPSTPYAAATLYLNGSILTAVGYETGAIDLYTITPPAPAAPTAPAAPAAPAPEGTSDESTTYSITTEQFSIKTRRPPLSLSISPDGIVVGCYPKKARDFCCYIFSKTTR